MATIIAPTIVRYTLKHVAGGSHNVDFLCDVSIDLIGVGATRDGAIDDFNSHFCGMWQDHGLTSLTSYCTFQGAHWIDLNSADGRTGFLGPAGGHPTNGADSSTFGAIAPCYLVHKNTAGNRSERQGRMFYGPLSESAFDPNGVVNSTKKTEVTTNLEAFRTAVSSWTMLPAANAAIRVVHVHKPDKKDESTWYWTSSTVDSFTIDNVCATQRRRQRA